jgi:ubiquinol-cytochrome c reductase cytochrome c subunit
MRWARALWLALLVAGLGAAPARAQAGGLSPLFEERCSSCHGADGTGVPNTGPSLIGAGEQAADFYLRTGRMPLANPTDQPVRAPRTLTDAQITQLVEEIGRLGGPSIPHADPSAGSLSQGQDAFATFCAGCHQISATGGVVTGATVPSLDQSTATDIAEAVRIGPYLMPRFGPKEIDQRQLDSIARYVLDATRRPDDRGGIPLGHLGPIPEGMVAWLVAVAALLVVARLTGERAQ